MDFFNVILKDILYILFAAVVIISVRYLVVFINKGVDYISEKINNLKNEEFKKYCKEMMQAAETMTDILLTGSEKKSWVIEKLTDYALKKNLSITESEISNLIQAIFQELDGITLNKYKSESKAEITIEDLEHIISENISKVLDINSTNK